MHASCQLLPRPPHNFAAMAKLPCRHCKRRKYAETAHRKHELSCPAGRLAAAVATATAAVRRVRRRYEGGDDEGHPNAPARMEVDLDDAYHNMDDPFDHHAQPWAPHDSLTVVPTMREERAAAMEAQSSSQDATTTCAFNGDMDDLIDIFEKDLLDDGNDSDQARGLDSDCDDDSIDAYEYYDVTHNNGNDDDDVNADPPSNAPPIDGSNPPDESLLEMHKSKYVESAELPTSMLAQLDLALLLRKTGAPLYLHDKIIDWVQHYSQEDEKMWTENKFLHRKELLTSLSETFDTKRRQPTFVPVDLGDDDLPRVVDVPKFPFVDELLSLLHDKEVMDPDNIVEGYNLFTGLVDGKEFWVHNSIDEADLLAIPTPRDPDQILGEVLHGTKFQMARQQFCTQENHMAVPLVFFYDKATHDKSKAISTAPIMFTVAFLKNSVRTRRFVWRLLALVPNLSIGEGASKDKDADTKAEEHHKVLREAFREIQEVVNRGGIRTKINGREVVLKIWIHFVIGDTEGHNELCGQMGNTSARPVRDCTCTHEQLSKFPQKCVSITRPMVQAENHNAATLNAKYSYRPMVDGNVFDDLPMGNSIRGINACGNFESLHVFDQGILRYVAKVIDKLIIGPDDKARLNDMFRAMSRWLERSSDRDFPRRAMRFNSTDGTNMTASESKGNMLVFLLVLMTRDGRELFEKHLATYRKNNSTSYPTIALVRASLVDLICYEKWVNQANTAAEVICAKARVEKAMKALLKAFPRDAGNGWNVPKFHGAGRLHCQMCIDGDGSGWTSAHGEHFHKEVCNRNVKNTQRRYNTVARQTACRCGEGVTFAAAYAHSKCSLMPGFADDGELSPVTCMTATTSREQRSYMPEDLKVVDEENTRKVPYELTLPAAPEGATNAGDIGTAEVVVKWTDPEKRASMKNVKLFNDLLVGLYGYAVKNKWYTDIEVKGHATVKMKDPTTGNDVTYRSDPKYRGKAWRDWAIVNTYPAGTTVASLPEAKRAQGLLCPGWIAGFVQFTQALFPTPGRNADKEGTPDVDPAIYAVVRCSTRSYNFDKQFCTEFKLVRGDKSLYVLPLSAVVGPLAVVPNVHTSDFRYIQEIDSFLAIKPYRRWGDHFGASIDTKEAYSNDDDEDDDDDEEEDVDEEET